MNSKRKSSLRNEWSSLFRNRKLLISVSAVALIPLLYSSLFLWAFWDPYDKLDTLPVAIVNLDQGAIMEGKEFHVGDEFVQKIKETDGFDWRFVDQQEAMDGLRNNRYYIGLEIPEDFSQKATDVLNEQSVAAMFHFYPNESYNFLSSQIGKTAVDRMKVEISQQLTKTYTQTIFTTFNKLSDGLVQAADGAKKLSEGSITVNDGLVQVNSNLGKLMEGTLPIRNGIIDLNHGAQQLNNGLNQLQISSGQLAGGLTELSSAHKQLVLGSAQADASITKLNNGLTAAEKATNELKQGADGLSVGLEKWAAAHPDLAKDESLQQLIGASKQVASGTDLLAASSKQLADGSSQLYVGSKTLAQGMTTFGEKLDQAQAGGTALAAGTQSAVSGGAVLLNGLSQLSGGADQLAEGTKQLKDGTDRLTAGSSQIVNGTNELSSKLQEASTQTSEVHTTDATYSKIANPVQVEEDVISPVPNYGTGFAPYFISLGLFVGSLLLTIVLPLKDTSLMPRSGFSWFMGKWGMMLSIGVIQAVIVDIVLLFGLGIEVQSIPYFMLFSVLVSWTFMSLVQFLVTAFGDPGRFFAIIILILQLTTSAGTFPLELIPAPLQVFNAWLPMSYTVSGYKAVISSGDFSYLGHNALILGAFTVGASLLTLTYFIVNFRKKAHSKQNDPSPAVTI